MACVTPWISVEPGTNPDAVLGNLPFTQGAESFLIPVSVVPDDAAGILVFAGAALSGVNPSIAWWHVAVPTGDGEQNWFSLLIAGDPTGQSVTVNSQTFWLPMPADRTLSVTLFVNDLPSPANQGTVEIHGYLPAVA